jgi:hypothetical protein
MADDASLSGSLLKRSEWIGQFNERHALVRAGALVWRGGAQPRSIALDANTTFGLLQGDMDGVLIVRRDGRTAVFRAARGGPPLLEWYRAFAAARGPVPIPVAQGLVRCTDDHGRAWRWPMIGASQEAAAAVSVMPPAAAASRPPPPAEDTYEGERNEAGQREGAGTMRYADGDVYEGQWANGREEGRGTYRWAHGDVYDGEYRDGFREGQGVLSYASGHMYVGQHRADRREGRGYYRDSEGAVLVCRFRAGKPAGEGVRWSADRSEARRLVNGTAELGPTSPETARALTGRVGLPVPPADATVVALSDCVTRALAEEEAEMADLLDRM